MSNLELQQKCPTAAHGGKRETAPKAQTTSRNKSERMKIRAQHMHVTNYLIKNDTLQKHSAIMPLLHVAVVMSALYSVVNKTIMLQPYCQGQQV